MLVGGNTVVEILLVGGILCSFAILNLSRMSEAHALASLIALDEIFYLISRLSAGLI
jgi:hypothetical protein